MHGDGVAALCIAFMKMASGRSGRPQLYSNWRRINIHIKKRQIHTPGFQATAVRYLKNQHTQFAVFTRNPSGSCVNHTVAVS